MKHDGEKFTRCPECLYRIGQPKWGLRDLETKYRQDCDGEVNANLEQIIKAEEERLKEQDIKMNTRMENLLFLYFSCLIYFNLTVVLSY